ncbi:MAG: hypothetical protein J0M04_23100 [Verrucomicrobia bacterium]|nr:hypothetical protein [Verrucomicrobiota bacterium]
MRKRVSEYAIGNPAILAWVSGLLVHLLFAGGLWAAFSVETWRSDAGLPSQTVTSITQTTDGYLWVGTMNGLARFDGVSFVVFSSGNTPELTNPSISQVERRRAGGLWISTMDGHLFRMENGRFFPEPDATLSGSAPGAEILAEAPDGSLWITTRDRRLAQWKDGVLTLMNGRWGRGPESPIQARVSPSGDLILNGDLRQQCGACRLVDGEPVPVGHGFDSSWNYHAPGRDRSLWISDGKSVRLWRDGVWLSPEAAVKWRNRPLSFGIETRDRSLWLSTMGGGVFRYGIDGSVVQVGRKDGMGCEAVTRLFEDRSGSVWAATDGGGLSRIRPAFFSRVITTAPAPSVRITALAAAADGNGVWAGTDGDGLLRLLGDGSEGSDAGTKEIDRTEVVSALEREPGEVLAGTLRNGFRKSHGDRMGVLSGFPGSEIPVRALFRDSKGRIWVGQRSGNRVLRILSDASFSSGKIAADYLTLPNPGPDTDIRCFAEDSAGGIWAGCDAGGVYQIKPGGSVSRFTHADGLAGDNVWSMLAMPDGAVWIGHAGGGLTRWKGGTFSVCGAARGFPEEVVCGMADGGDGGLWIAGGKGIWRIALDELNRCCDGLAESVRAVRFGPGDGLPPDGIASTQGGVIRTGDGRLWFGTDHGVWIAHPLSYQPDPVPPLVAIEGISVDGKRRVAGEGPDRIGHEARYFEFRYSGLSLSHPSLVVFRYKLEGADTDWRDADTARSVFYSGLAPGSYVFRVKARSRDHVWSETDASYPIIIEPPWWRRASTVIAAVLLAVATAVGVTRFIVGRRAARQAEEWRRRHAIEAERGRIARDIHDRMGAGLNEIALLGDWLCTRESAVPESAEISARARELARAMDETVWAVNPAKDTVDGLVSYLAHAIGVWLKHSGIRSRLDLPAERNERVLSGEIRNHFYLACKESVLNAVKHSGAKEIRFSIRATPGQLEAAVSDDGVGFDPSLVRTGGNGLANIRLRLAQVGGTASISSSPGAGTRVTLSMPIPTGDFP